MNSQTRHRTWPSQEDFEGRGIQAQIREGGLVGQGWRQWSFPPSPWPERVRLLLRGAGERKRELREKEKEERGAGGDGTMGVVGVWSLLALCL